MNGVKWILYLAALGTFIWYVFFREYTANAMNNKQNTEELSTDDVPQSTIEDEADYDESGYDSDESSYDSEGSEETTTNNDIFDAGDEPAVVEQEISSSSGIDLNSKFLIIVGSFGVKSNAEKMLRRVESTGKEGVISYINGLHRVVAATSDDRSDAIRLRRHFTDVFQEQAFMMER